MTRKFAKNNIVGDRAYEGLRASDGTDIGSRKKHRDYMKRTGLTTADDFKQTWAKKAEERERGIFQNPTQQRERIEALKHAIEQHRRLNR
jgi:hypothetical protein